MSFSFVSNREVRTVPKGWQHPRGKDGRFLPLLDRAEWQELADELGADAPRIGTPMPPVWDLAEAETEIMAYETTSEGTPCSPAFPNTPEGRLALVNYCAEHVTTFGDHRADAETWAAILFGDGVTLVDSDGRVTF